MAVTELYGAAPMDHQVAADRIDRHEQCVPEDDGRPPLRCGKDRYTDQDQTGHHGDDAQPEDVTHREGQDHERVGNMSQPIEWASMVPAHSTVPRRPRRSGRLRVQLRFHRLA